ncbi:hypothetical protein SCLCIDRAFT_1220417 [Scleroderma citrinum Foug A]|uniref:Uncharacterized protein n=1 Tax=Scleroderma citrinum Foug A TaxID=1036808 RepID=A0A0C3DJ71_9AGAM|nr:hypothetical protein SCLCIDRAFT_1220417 [Scleroderma citrinum Foug A]
MTWKKILEIHDPFYRTFSRSYTSLLMVRDTIVFMADGVTIYHNGNGPIYMD